MNNCGAFGNTITEVITVKEKMNQMFKDKLFLVLMVLGLLTIVAAAGVATMQKKGAGQNPYLQVQEEESLLSGEEQRQAEGSLAGESNAQLAEKENEGSTLAAGSKENPETVVSEKSYQVAEETSGRSKAEAPVKEAGSGLDAATALVLDFTEESRMLWPVEGNVLLDYSMDSTIYFPTLDQYKCNPGLVIQGEVSTPVCAPANARVLATGVNEEIGSFVTLDLGNEYTLVCGQLKELAVTKGEYLEKGQLMGYLAEPTKYYTVEGSNLYMEMMHQSTTVDPLDYLE